MKNALMDNVKPSKSFYVDKFNKALLMSAIDLPRENITPDIVLYVGRPNHYESFAELVWDKRCSNLAATFANIYFELLCR